MGTYLNSWNSPTGIMWGNLVHKTSCQRLCKTNRVYETKMTENVYTNAIFTVRGSRDSPYSDFVEQSDRTSPYSVFTEQSDIASPYSGFKLKTNLFSFLGWRTQAANHNRRHLLTMGAALLLFFGGWVFWVLSPMADHSGQTTRESEASWC